MKMKLRSGRRMRRPYKSYVAEGDERVEACLNVKLTLVSYFFLTYSLQPCFSFVPQPARLRGALADQCRFVIDSFNR